MACVSCGAPLAVSQQYTYSMDPGPVHSSFSYADPNGSQCAVATSIPDSPELTSVNSSGKLIAQTSQSSHDRDTSVEENNSCHLHADASLSNSEPHCLSEEGACDDQFMQPIQGQPQEEKEKNVSQTQYDGLFRGSVIPTPFLQAGVEQTQK